MVQWRWEALRADVGDVPLAPYDARDVQCSDIKITLNLQLFLKRILVAIFGRKIETM